MLKRRTKKLSNSMVRRLTTTHELVCNVCGEEEVTVSSDTKAVICAYCVQRMVAPPENYIKKEKSDKPRGWHFKPYFEHNGVVYSKGEEITDKSQIADLKKRYGKVAKVKKPTAKRRGKKNARTSR